MKHVIRLGSVVAVVGLFFSLGLWKDGAGAMSLGADGPDPFPDAWFFYEAKRPEPLRSLEGKPAQEITLAEWRGDETSLNALRGKVVVLDFWATWCGPCIAAIPKNIAMVEKYGDDGFAFIGIHDSNAGWDKVDTMIQEKGINYPVALDARVGDSGVSTKAYNLQFWPTYVVIDREGIVRAAGLVPGKVEEVVKILLAEPYDGEPAGDKAKGSSFPDEWFNGGEKRPSAFRRVENKPMKPIEAAQWIGEPQTAQARTRRVTVVQFVRPEFPFSMKQLDALMPIAQKFSKQGVVFLIVCDAKGDWELMANEAEKRGLSIAVALDSPLGEDEIGSGVIGQSFGVSFGPATAVIDRAGVVRAVGLKTEHLEKVINTLLAERLALPQKNEEQTEKGG